MKSESNPGQMWKEHLSYAALFTSASTDTATNRFSGGQGYTYDKNGNLVQDPTNSSRQFVFNGDNKQAEVKDANGVPIGKYFYDGEGKRVKKVTDLETAIFVYSSGKLIEEYSTKAPPPNPTTNYTMTDQLGSPRVLTNSLGEVVSRRDFMPFGEELSPDPTLRVANLKYGTGDGIRQKFTGYLKDEETQLDFAEARMYENRHARFTAVDPLLASGKNSNPQTFNRYVYVLNSPLVFTDPTGLQVASWTGSVYTNGQTFGREPFIGENSWTVQGKGIRFVDANDGYSYSYSEAGSTLLGSTDALNARAARMMPDRIPAFLQGFSQATDDALTGMARGARNFGTGTLNFLTNPLGPTGFAAGVPNPFAIDPLPYDNARQFSYGSATEIGIGAGTIVAGGAFGGGSSLSVVPETQIFRFSQSTASATFSEAGTFGGRTVLDVAGDLRSGALSPSQVPVNYVQRGSFNLIDNTRSSIALQEAGIPMNQWNLVNRTRSLRVETAVTDKLANNGLTTTGTNSVRFNGCTYFCQ